MRITAGAGAVRDGRGVQPGRGAACHGDHRHPLLLTEVRLRICAGSRRRPAHADGGNHRAARGDKQGIQPETGHARRHSRWCPA